MALKLRRYILNHSKQVALFSRFTAKSIDIFLVLILAIFLYPLGIIMSIIYLSIADSLPKGQSVGKRIIGFAVISLEDGSPCSVKQSTIRNLPLTIPLIIAIIPLWGWILGFFIAVPLVTLEIYLLIKLDSGHRLGDVMADTSVMANDGNNLNVSKKIQSSWFGTSKGAQT